MGTISTILGPSAGVAAHQQTPQTTRVEGPTTPQPASPAAVGQAAVVTLSASSRNRAASSGTHKQVDGSFDKQEVKDKKDKKKDSDGSVGNSVKTTA